MLPEGYFATNQGTPESARRPRIKTLLVCPRDGGDRSTFKCMGIMFRPRGGGNPPSHSTTALLAETSSSQAMTSFNSIFK
jgi:hypothetical protein